MSPWISQIVCAVGLVLFLPFPGAAVMADSIVYRCTVEGVVTFSDRPCGADARAYRADDTRVSTFTAPPLSTQPAPRATPRRGEQQDSIAAHQVEQAERCKRIDRSLRQIRAHLRAGYDAKQGERLAERQRKLKQQQRDERC